MTGLSVARVLAAAGVAVALALGSAAPALAQNGALQGKVITDKGLPADQATVEFQQVNGTRKTNTLTDKNGIWIKTGLQAGEWNVSVKKDKLTAKATPVTVVAGKTTEAPEFVIDEAGGRAVFKNSNAKQVSPEQAAKEARENAELQKLTEEANAAVAEGRADEAIEKLTTLTKKLKNCSKCFINLGDVYVKTQKFDEAEKAFLKAIEYDATSADPYRALINVYNTQGKLEDAKKAAAKMNELMAASGGADAISTYNTGVVLWNQFLTDGKTETALEAAAMFDKATQIDPKYAPAFYRAGLAYLSQSKNAEAKVRLTEYLKLAPTGEHAKLAKDMLDSIK
jgi:Tfp pilus assembly protein PilF